MDVAIICVYNDLAIFNELTKRELLSTASFCSTVLEYDNRGNKLFKNSSEVIAQALKDTKEPLLLFIHQDVGGNWDKFDKYVKSWQPDWGLVGATDERRICTKIVGRNLSEPQEVQLIDGHCICGRRELFENLPKSEYWAEAYMEVCLLSLQKGFKNIILPNNISHRGGQLIGSPQFYPAICRLEERYHTTIWE